MIRDDASGSRWANVGAIVAVISAIGVLYLPLILG